MDVERSRHSDPWWPLQWPEDELSSAAKALTAELDGELDRTCSFAAESAAVLCNAAPKAATRLSRQVTHAPDDELLCN
jgi:hypothetical protein